MGSPIFGNSHIEEPRATLSQLARWQKQHQARAPPPTMPVYRAKFPIPSTRRCRPGGSGAGERYGTDPISPIPCQAPTVRSDREEGQVDARQVLDRPGSEPEERCVRRYVICDMSIYLLVALSVQQACRQTGGQMDRPSYIFAFYLNREVQAS